MPNYNLSPREELLKDPAAIAAHHTLVENESLRKHLAIAMAEMQIRASGNTPADNFNACASSHLRMLGASDFLAIFLNLAEVQQPASAKVDKVNLPGNVSQFPRKNN